jgi:K(+)-stimulated pyrophosphate-energized sodium pump
MSRQFLAEGGSITLSGGGYTIVGVVAVVALAALVIGYVLLKEVLAAGQGTAKMQDIAKAVQEGAAAYLKRQRNTLAIFGVIVFLLLFALPADDWNEKIGRSIFFLVGAAFSFAIGYLGMWLATQANLRVAAASREEGGREVAMRVAFRTGGVVGMITVGLGLFGAAVVVLVYTGQAPKVLEGFGFGAALIAMFMRVGGGIFTKAADVGADLVGKVEQGIPEDDPRNAATIADNVGDNVGDCAGMAADLFESYAVMLVAALILGSTAFGVHGLIFPLIVPAIGVITAVIGVYITKARAGEGGLVTINRSFYISAVISAVLSAIASFVYLPSSFSDFGAGYENSGNPAVIATIAVIIGIVLAAVILKLTGYYTGTEYKPVKDVAQTSETGGATVILSGISVGFESAVYTALVIGAAVFGAYLLGGGVALFAVALAGTGLLTTVGVIVAMDTFGGGQHHQGHHQGHRDRDGRPRGDRALRLLLGRDHEDAGGHGQRRRHRHGRGQVVRQRDRQPEHAGRRDHRRGRGVHVLGSGRQRGFPRGRRGGLRSPPPVPRHPGHHGGHHPPRVRQGRRHRHARLAA